MRWRGWLLVSVLLSAAVLAVVLALTVDEATYAALGSLDLSWLGVARLAQPEADDPAARGRTMFQ